MGGWLPKQLWAYQLVHLWAFLLLQQQIQAAKACSWGPAFTNVSLPPPSPPLSFLSLSPFHHCNTSTLSTHRIHLLCFNSHSSSNLCSSVSHYLFQFLSPHCLLICCIFSVSRHLSTVSLYSLFISLYCLFLFTVPLSGLSFSLSSLYISIHFLFLFAVSF